jgi:hypothetical protein
VSRVFLCVSIDCECDKGSRWRTQLPLRFDGVHVGIAARLQPLFEACGAKPTYLLSPEVLRDPSCVEVLSALPGCELGTHLHGEMADPGVLVPAVTHDVQRDYPPEIERAKLEWLTTAFRDAIGRAPLAFRAGRFGIGPNTISALEALGYGVESSVTPGIDYGSLSAGLSFVGAPRQPYRPDPSRPSRAGSSSILEVPVTTVPRAVAALPLVGRFVEPRWLRPTGAEGPALVAIARAAVADARRAAPERPVILNAMFHNVEVVAGASPYASTDRAAQRIVDRLAFLLRWARREHIGCIGLSDVGDVLGGWAPRPQAA